ncbi:8408_t:CDS:1 [Funneliformis caledonium]|uniref:8408_t:CDS:1 n=1 Tax=Funneliformis caledonium TaxID=1117310 RepID=A0A9N9E9S6_9GLOM|nr:8408_t:CDS:1 [Funneliformis caledonium]
MAQDLSAECLQQIISYLEDDNKSLHSCLLVNRFWCYNTVSTLWLRPWRSYEITQTSATSLIQTYVDCLPEESKFNLYNNGITRKKHLTSTTPIFDYPSFLRSLDYDYMYWSISQWLISCWLYRVLNCEDEINECQTDRVEEDIIRDAPEEKFSDDEYNDDRAEEENEKKAILVARELCKLFKNRCKTFHDLRLENKAIQSDEFPFLPLPIGPYNYLENLQQLVCLGDNKSELLLAISNVCKSLRRIYIGFPLALQWKSHYESDAISLGALIKKQIRLENICLYGYKRLISCLIESLLSQSKSLNTLELMYTDFRESQDYQSLTILPTCKNLTSLKIHNCFIPPDDGIMPLTSLQQLEEFDFCNEWNPLYPLPQQKFWDELFKNNTKTLRKLSLWWIRSDSKDGAKIIDSIIKQCSENISVLHLPILWTNEILNLSSYCKQLKEFSFSGDDFDANEFLSQLGKFVPATLGSLTIKDGHCGGWNFTEKCLSSFLSGCRAKLRIMDLTSCSCMTDRHYDVINRRGVINCLHK